MSTNPFEGRALVCSFAYANGHHCRMPRKTSHPFLCTYHARKEAQAEAADQVGRDLATRFSANYLSGSDLSSALAHMMSAVAQGHLKPRAASTLAYLSQTLLQAIHLSQHEYINAFGTTSWREEIRAAFAQPSIDRPSEDPEPEPDVQEPDVQELEVQEPDVQTPDVQKSEPLPQDAATYVESILTQVYQNK
jgi:hypothetical protein